MGKSEKRKEYIRQNERNYLEYLGAIGDSYRERINQLSYLLGDVHDLSNGEYKERLLVSELRKHIPKRYAIGTGFVAFPCWPNCSPEKTQPAKKQFIPSKQLDIVIYDDLDYCPLFIDGDFVVLPPDSLRVIIEVKGYLSRSNNFISNIIDFGDKWYTFYKAFEHEYTLGNSVRSIHPPKLLAYHWQEYIDDKGNRLPEESLVNIITNKYKEYNSNHDNMTLCTNGRRNKHFPVLNTCYLYGNYAIQELQTNHSWGYGVIDGCFTSYNPQRDKTIADLIVEIQRALGVKTNAMQLSTGVTPYDSARYRNYSPVCEKCLRDD